MKIVLEDLIQQARAKGEILRVTVYPNLAAVPNVDALADTDNLVEVAFLLMWTCRSSLEQAKNGIKASSESEVGPENLSISKLRLRPHGFAILSRS